ncbi:hypothetical protein DFH28DRAFT_453419 [Melampsora americana]|nr:hypothetical protein DFH28DRAFT_453419 [Melampsora americana]
MRSSPLSSWQSRFRRLQVKKTRAKRQLCQTGYHHLHQLPCFARSMVTIHSNYSKMKSLNTSNYRVNLLYPLLHLFPTFEHRHRHQSLPNCSVVPVRPMVTTQTPQVVKKRSVNQKTSQKKRMSQPPPASVNNAASPVNEQKPKPSAAEKVARWLKEADSEEARLVKVLEDVQPRKPSKWSALGIEMADEELISNQVEAKRNR